jgi:pilus assembly protein CpaE
MKIVVVGPRDPQLEQLLRQGSAQVVTVPDLDLFEAKTPKDPPNVIVLDIRNQTAVPAALAAVRRALPATGVIVVAARLDPAMMLDAMRAGVNEFLTDPLSLDEVRRAIEGVSASSAGAKEGKVFAFIGSKGGVGATTIAVNVASALAQSGTGQVLFIDLQPYGDAALFFGADPRFSVIDALENTHRLDAAFLKGLVVRKAGVDLLACSNRSLKAFDTQGVHTLIEFARRHYEHVVLDVLRSDWAMLDALAGVSHLIIVANQELAAVRGAAKVAAALHQRHGKDRVQIVVSRYDTASSIRQHDIEGVTGSSIGHLFPSNYPVAIDALNRGCPLVVENHTKLAGSFMGYARTLAGLGRTGEDEPSKPAGLLGRLTGRR